MTAPFFKRALVPGVSRTRRLATVSAIVAMIAVSRLVQVITLVASGQPLILIV